MQKIDKFNSMDNVIFGWKDLTNKSMLIFIIVGLILMITIISTHAIILDQYTECINNLCQSTIGISRFYYDGNIWKPYNQAVLMKYANNEIQINWKNNYIYLIPEIKDKTDKKLNENFTTTISDNNYYYKWGHKLKKSKDSAKFKYSIISNLECDVNKNNINCGDQLISFDDLITSGFNISLDKTKLEINIENIAENSDIYLDPVLIFNGSAIIEDAYVLNTTPSLNTINDTTLYFGIMGGEADYTYINFNISSLILSNITILDAELYSKDSGSTSFGYYLHEVYSNNFDFNLLNWTNQPCGINESYSNPFLNATYCNNTGYSSTLKTLNTTIYQTWNLTTMFNKDLGHNNITFMVRGNNTLTGRRTAKSSESTVVTGIPYLNITYLYFGTLANLTVTALQSNGTAISSFGVNISNSSWSAYSQTSSGSVIFVNLTGNNTYNITINATNYITNWGLKQLENISNLFNLTLLYAGRANISIYNEYNNSLLNGTNVTLLFISPNGSIAYNITTSNGSSYITLGTDFWEIRYSSSNYYPRSYFVNLTSDTDIRLYLLNRTYSNLIYFVVKDNYGNTIENSYVVVYKRFMPENIYRIVDFQKTDYSGRGSSYLNKCDTQTYCSYYRFGVYYPLGNLKLLTETDYKVIDDTINFRIDTIGDILASYKLVDNLYYSLTYANATPVDGVFSLTYADFDNIIENICLNITQRGSINDNLICSSCSSAASGVISCNVNQSGILIADVYLYSNTQYSDYKIDTLVKDFSDRFNTFGATGLFLGFVIIAFLVLLGSFHPQISLLMLIFGLILTYFLGFIWLSYTTLVGIIVMILIYLFIQKDG